MTASPNLPLCPLDAAIAERAGRLRRNTGRRLPDALIAATALEHRLVLVTRNARDFEDIRGLKIRPPNALVGARLRGRIAPPDAG